MGRENNSFGVAKTGFVHVSSGDGKYPPAFNVPILVPVFVCVTYTAPDTIRNNWRSGTSNVGADRLSTCIQWANH